MEAAATRSKIRWVEEGEKPTKYFFSLEKSRREMQTIEALKDEHGIVQTEPREILKIAADFYKGLYSKNGSVEENAQMEALKQVDKQLSREQKDQMSGPLRREELTQARQVANPRD